MMSKKKSGFTLVELLVVIAIIGLIATISVLALGNARAKSRDSKRVADVKQMQTALELFYSDMNRYPTLNEWASGSLHSTSTETGTTTYMSTIPAPVTPTDSSCTSRQNSYTYQVSADGGSYSISFCLGNSTGSMSAGAKCLASGETQNSGCFICGDNVTVTTLLDGAYTCNTGAPNYDRCTYGTTQIGDQCWMKQSLNFGTVISTTFEMPTNNNAIEKNCWNNTYTYCQSGGGIYRWDEAMNYVTTESTQGICPPGWHIPSDSEQHQLSASLADPGQACDANEAVSCSAAATYITSSSTVGFMYELPGYITGVGQGPPTGPGTRGGIWSSTAYDTNNIWYRYLGVEIAPTIRTWDPKQDYGLSVRCVKN